MSTEPIVEDLTQIVGDLEIPCDWAANDIHEGEGAARWQVTLVVCVCGRTGIRLICGPCKNKAMAVEDAAECGVCGEVYQPWRRVIQRIDWLR